MQIRVVYHTEKPAALVEVTEVVPGLCIGRNPAYQEYGLRKWAVFHSPSALIVHGTKTRRAARELAERLGALCDWNRFAGCISLEDIAAAHAIAKQY